MCPACWAALIAQVLFFITLGLVLVVLTDLVCGLPLSLVTLALAAGNWLWGWEVPNWVLFACGALLLGRSSFVLITHRENWVRKLGLRLYTAIKSWVMPKITRLRKVRATSESGPQSTLASSSGGEGFATENKQMCMYHEGLRHLSTWWPQNEVPGVMQRDLALSLVVLPAKEKAHNFLDWFAQNGSADLWQVEVLRKMAAACQAGLMDQIRDLPDERWEWGVGQVLPHLASPASATTGSEPPPTIFHAMMVTSGLKVNEILAIGVLQGVRPRTTCLKWYSDERGTSGNGYPIPLMERLAEKVFKGDLLEKLEKLAVTDADAGLALLRQALTEEPASATATPVADCCKGATPSATAATT